MAYWVPVQVDRTYTRFAKDGSPIEQTVTVNYEKHEISPEDYKRILDWARIPHNE